MAITNIYTRGVKFIKISKVDTNQSSSATELPNVDNIRILFPDLISPTDYPAISVVEYPTYYLYTISPTDITSSATTDSLVVLEPYFDGVLRTSDSNVIQNNVDNNVFSGFYMDVDYNNSAIIPQNQAQILNGTADRAQIQPWNYTYASQIRGRYIGQQQSAIKYNAYTSASQFPTASAFGFSGSWPGDSVSPGRAGSVVVAQLDSCIYEYTFMGGGYVENSYGGTVSLGNIYLVGDDKDDVYRISPSNPLYLDIIQKNMPRATSIFPNLYDVNNTSLPSEIEVLYPSLSLPDASYWFPSSLSDNYGYVGGFLGPVGYSYQNQFFLTGSSAISQYPALPPLPSPGQPRATLNYSPAIDAPYIRLNKYVTASLSVGGLRSTAAYPVATRINGVQQTGSYVPADELEFEISRSLSRGERWFVSLYQGGGTLTSLQPAGLGNEAPTTNQYQLGYPFEISKVLNFNGPQVGYGLRTGGTDTSITSSIYVLKDSSSTILQYVPTCSIPSHFLTNSALAPSPVDFGDRAFIQWIGAFPTSSNTALLVDPDTSPTPASTSNNYGIVFTKATSTTNALTVIADSWRQFSGVTPGYITLAYPKQVIIDNIDYITKQYGNNPN
jgi:hypothetical protein